MTTIVHVQLSEVVKVSGDRMGRLTACGAVAVLFRPYVRVCWSEWPDDGDLVTCPSCRRKMGERA